MPDDSAARRTTDSSMAVHAYTAIKKRILDFRYAPGERLSEAQLAKELGLGRSPIRTALARLKSDGWIAVSPQSGTYIKSLSDKEIADLIDLRLLRRAFTAFCPKGVADLDERAFDDFNQFDSLLHLTVYRAAGNALIAEMLANLLDKVQWLKTSARPSAARIRSGYTELRGILEALEARRPKEASARMREHITNAADFSARTRTHWRSEGEDAVASSKPALLRRLPRRRAA
jgi:GntR family transcriptional regulator, rspAB operon transcriptional repressor